MRPYTLTDGSVVEEVSNHIIHYGAQCVTVTRPDGVSDFYPVIAYPRPPLTRAQCNRLLMERRELAADIARAENEGMV